MDDSSVLDTDSQIPPSTTGQPSPRRRPRTKLGAIYASSVGRKYVMALSGLAIVGFVVAHLIGTLKIFLGPEATNEYGEALRDLGEHLVPRTHLLWIFRIGLIAAFTVHMHAAFTLDRRNREASQRYITRQDKLAATYASRTMLWSGIIVALFIVFHLADLTWGTINPDFERGDAYGNQIASFQNPLISAVYLLGVGALTLHLFHGLWSLTRSLGASSELLSEPNQRRVAAVIALAIGLGYASIPLAVLSGTLS